MAALAVLGVALLVGGLWVGSFVRGDQIDRVAPDGALLEVQLADGTVYLGALEDEGDYLVLSGPAVIVPGSSEEETTSYTVQPLSGDPYSILGPILIDRDRVTFIGAVSAGSGIERAYLDAISGTSQETPAPS